ncbi:MAG: hypothetical protein LBS27_05075 [Bifidobacteriaceae bacterium]|nr:hypothetical protein [Bifidobacteriaceae bacterium]
MTTLALTLGLALTGALGLAMAPAAVAADWAPGGVVPVASAGTGARAGAGAGTAAPEAGRAGGEAAQDRSELVVLIGTTGLGWADVSAAATAAIWDSLEAGAGAAGLLNRSVRVGSCPVEGWLAVGAGVRIGEVAPGVLSDLKGVDAPSCRALVEPVDGQIPGWRELTAPAVEAGTADQIGALAAWLSKMELTASAIGPGAALALADAAGVVGAEYQPAPDSASGLRQAVEQAVAAGSELLVVDVGTRTSAIGPEELDARIGVVLEALEAAAGSARTDRVMIASLADWGNPTMGVVLDRRPDSAGAMGGDQPWLIESNATKTPGLALVTDLTEVLEEELVPAPIGPVSPWRAGGTLRDAAAAQARLADLNRHAVAARQWGPSGWTAVMVIAAIGIFGPLILAARRSVTGGRGRSGAGQWSRLVRLLALAAGAFPAACLAANAVPWWRFGAPLAAWILVSAGLALLAAGIAEVVQRFWRGRRADSPLIAPGVIGLISAAVVLADPFIGRVFTRDAPLGYPTLLTARLYGYTNSVFAILVTGAILGAAILAAPSWAKGRRLAAAAPIALVGLAVLVVDANPHWGADLGGAVGIVGGFAVMAATAADLRVNWKRALVVILAGVAAAGAAAWLDYLRGPGRWTHLGGFVQTVASGGLGEVLARKGWLWLRLSVGPAVGLAVALLICFYLSKRGAFAALKTKTWTAAPVLRPLVAGLATAWALGSLVNDSGLVVAVTGLAVAGPLLSAGLAPARGKRPRPTAPS